MPLRYKCLILDHDDTAVDSSATIHYPAHLEAMRLLRPGCRPVDLQGWFLKNFDPGIMEYLSGELGMSPPELRWEYRIWSRFGARRIPSFFPGFLEALRSYRESGGRVAVVSHSEKRAIARHYRHTPRPQRFFPDLILGWHRDERKRKPSPWPVLQVLNAFKLEARQALIVDDLKPGVLMARSAGVPAAASGWCHRIPRIEAYMRRNCLAYLETVEEFARFILTPEEA